MTRVPQSHAEYFAAEQQRLVYLTPDATHPLLDVEEDKVRA